MKKTILISLAVLAVLFFAFCYYRNITNPAVLSVYDNNTSFFQRFLPQFPGEIKQNKFSEIIQRARSKQGTYGIYIKEIGGSEEYSYNKDELFYGASLFKIPIGLAAMKEMELGNIAPDEEFEILGNEFADGTGSLNEKYPGYLIAFDEIINKLFKESDNTAQNMLWRIVPQEQLLNSFGLITIKTYFYANNTVTPRQLANLLENFITGDYLSNDYKEKVLNKMSTTLFDDRINQGLTPDIRFAHKIGNWPDTGTWHDCGIAQKDNKSFSVCVMSRNTTYEDFLDVTKDVGEFLIILF